MRLKNSPTSSTALPAAHVVTIEDLNAMMAFIRNFQLKYSRKKMRAKRNDKRNFKT